MNQLIGTGTALVTPFKNGEIDFTSLRRIIDFQIGGQVEFLVILGTTGEAATLSAAEKHDLVRFVVEHVNDRIPIVVGIGGNNTRAVVNTMETFDLSGVTAILSASPAYNKPSQAGIIEHYKHLAEASPLPLIMYNVPGRTSSNLSAQTTLTLANSSSKIIGIKEASADMGQSTEILRSRPDDFLVWSGDDPTAVAHTALGGDGCISVMSNAWPKAFSSMNRKALKQDFEGARKLNNKLYGLHHWLYVEGNPVGIKTAMAIKGLCEEDVRLPLIPMSDENKAHLIKEMEKEGLS